jgi:hypothetical protein
MGPVSLATGCQQKPIFSHCLIGCCGREAGYGHTNQTAVELWIMLGALLLRAVDLYESVDDFVKGCYVLTA